ncbi:transketolase, partial [Holdemanella sp. DFI.5.55]|nr:transketolase [Holdemanella sp. DFI.5.55]
VKAASWNYERVEDGNDLAQIDAALWRAKRSDKPTLIEVKTVIGYGAPKQGTNKVHGTPVGQDGLAVLKEKFDW